MSSASEGSGTRRRMKLRSRDRSSAMISEILRSCSVIPVILDGSPIHSCRRTAAANIVKIQVAETAGRAAHAVSRHRHGETLLSADNRRLGGLLIATGLGLYRKQHQPEAGCDFGDGHRRPTVLKRRRMLGKDQTAKTHDRHDDRGKYPEC